MLSGITIFAEFLENLANDPLTESAASAVSRGARGSVSPLTLRQMLRIAKRAAHYPEELVFDPLSNACLTRFMPSAERMKVESSLRLLDHGDAEDERNTSSETSNDDYSAIKEVSLEEFDGIVRIGSVSAKIVPPQNPALVPSVVFFDIPSHKLILKASDFWKVASCICEL